MSHDRVFLRNAADRIFAEEQIERNSGAAAMVATVFIANAGELIAHKAVEVWAGARMVAHLTAGGLDNQNH